MASMPRCHGQHAEPNAPGVLPPAEPGLSLRDGTHPSAGCAEPRRGDPCSDRNGDVGDAIPDTTRMDSTGSDGSGAVEQDMPSTHAWIHLHVVFSTKERRPLMEAAWRGQLRACLRGVLHRLGVLPLAVGGVGDHVHLLISIRPTHRLADTMRDLKAHSCHWVRCAKGCPDFMWQDGYGAFSVSPDRCERVRRYINAQEGHHRHRTFDSEYLALLEEHGMSNDGCCSS